MQICLLKSKLHRATVTETDLDYEGSLSLSPDLMDRARLLPCEKIDVYNITNGERFSTYVIEGKDGDVCLNGAAAWKAKAGDKIIIAAYCWLDAESAQSHKPTVVLLGKQNKIHSL